MSTAGDLDAGLGLAGAGELQAGSGPSTATLPTALVYEAPGRVFAIDSDGRFYSSHPVDQRVRLALLTIKGSIPAAPDQGFDWSTPFETGERLTADVTDRIHNALYRAEITNDDIEEVRIVVYPQRVRGRVSWEYEYRNKRTNARQVLSNGAT